MNLPNKLTIFRVVLIPVMVVFLLAQLLPGGAIIAGYDKWIALALFCLASFTDFLDGHIARSRNLITNFGKLMDPLADKLLVSAAMISLVALSRLQAWIVIVIIAREFAISGVRQLAAEKGRVIAASYWGKFKTVSQMAMIILLIADIPALRTLAVIMQYVALILTVVSLADYLYKNRDVILEGAL